MVEVRSDQPQKKRVSAKLIIALILLALALVFAFQNTGTRPVNFLWWTVSLPAWIWFVIILVIGVIVGSLFPWFRPKRKAAK